MRSPDVRFRRALPADYGAVLRLNRDNYRPHLSADEQQEGFLSALFSASQVAAMAEDLGITVADAQGHIAAFLCAFRTDFDHQSPVVAAMLAAYGRLHFEGKPLSAYASYVYGPVCIEQRFRHQGLLRGLYGAQLRELAGRFEIGVALVSRDNPHSLNAHILGLGMAEVGGFELNGNCYATVVFRVCGKRTGT
jgi:hypothetical protein